MNLVIEHLGTFAFLVIVRMAGFVAFVRLFTPFSALGQNIVLQTVLAAALAMPLFADIIVALPDSGATATSDFIIQGLTGLVAGASFAVLCSVPIRIAAAVGEVIDNARGLSANGPLNPVTREDATPLSSAVTAVLSLVIFTFGWHLDVLEDLYAVVPSSDLHALGASVKGAAPLWVRSVEVLGVLLVRALPLLGLLLAVDAGIAFATKNLKSGDMGGAENSIKILIVAAWLVFLLQGLLSSSGLASLREAFHGLASPLDRLLALVPR